MHIGYFVYIPIRFKHFYQFLKYYSGLHLNNHKPIFKVNQMIDVILNKISVPRPPAGTIKVSDRADKPIKSFLKSISWRIVGTLDTMIISYFITGRLSFAISIGSIEVFTKTVLYYLHERLWSHIHRLKLNVRTKEYSKQYELDRIEE
jgi:uncharacterized membrane protein